ncbi:MAG: helix-turn-helix domain-containing protein [Candidatus Aenigmarchaeota archaeon]|nr:helix-turn-helix domain-containing protein [Candidatus Aenigmarchaeota archaeon]
MVMRRGKELYAQHYKRAMEMHEQGVAIKDIASQLNISYSAAYHWVKGIRKPEHGSVLQFRKFLETNGPTPQIVIKERFPKHNEIFLISARRGVEIKRKVLSRKFGEFRTWYYLDGQEKMLESRLSELFEKYRKIVEKLTF